MNREGEIAREVDGGEDIVVCTLSYFAGPTRQPNEGHIWGPEDDGYKSIKLLDYITNQGCQE